MMTKVELETFVEGTTHYFATAANQPASVGSPYIVHDGRPTIQEFTGVINIAGKRRGIVYFTASRPMLTVMLMRMGETELTQENMCDLVGEVANTISGNARRDFGKDVMIHMSVGHGDNNPEQAQDPNTLAGKTLRLRDDGTVPPDNPFVGPCDGERPSRGVRSAERR